MGGWRGECRSGRSGEILGRTCRGKATPVHGRFTACEAESPRRRTRGVPRAGLRQDVTTISIQAPHTPAARQAGPGRKRPIGGCITSATGPSFCRSGRQSHLSGQNGSLPGHKTKARSARIGPVPRLLRLTPSSTTPPGYPVPRAVAGAETPSRRPEPARFRLPRFQWQRPSHRSARPGRRLHEHEDHCPAPLRVDGLGLLAAQGDAEPDQTCTLWPFHEAKDAQTPGRAPGLQAAALIRLKPCALSWGPPRRCSGMQPGYPYVPSRRPSSTKKR